jgi:hypothetical protein
VTRLRDFESTGDDRPGLMHQCTMHWMVNSPSGFLNSDAFSTSPLIDFVAILAVPHTISHIWVRTMVIIPMRTLRLYLIVGFEGNFGFET